MGDPFAQRNAQDLTPASASIAGNRSADRIISERICPRVSQKTAGAWSQRAMRTAGGATRLSPMMTRYT